MPDSVHSKDDILNVLRCNEERLRAFGVVRIGLFGSYMRGHQRVDSDVDLLVEISRSHKTFDNFMSLSFFLEDVLGRSVEVVTTESLSPYLGPHILAEAEYVSFAA